MERFEFIGNIKDDKALEAAEDIVIYGCGKNGKNLYLYLEEKGLSKSVKAFCDGNKNLWGEVFGKAEILSPISCSEKYPEAVYLIGSCMIKSMYETLNNNGIKRMHITRCEG